MRSYRLTRFGGPLELETRATPEPTGSEVLLEVVAAGVCHSDLHLQQGSYDLGRGEKMMVGERGVNLPLTLGHETVGRVATLGPEVSGVQSGELYVIYPWIGCGSCPACKAGEEPQCLKPRTLGIYRDGGFADHILVPHPRYLLPLDGLDPVAAAPYSCSGLTTFAALKKAGPLIEREPIVIFGAGGLGLMSLRLLKALGGVGAVVLDVDDQKRKAALDVGAIAAIDGNASDARSQIVRTVGHPPAAVIDFVGSEQTANIGFNALARAGKLITVGLFGGAAPWPMPVIALKAVTIQGSYVGTLAELKELLELVRQKNVPSIPITTAPLDQADEMLNHLHNGQLVGRAVLTP